MLMADRCTAWFLGEIVGANSPKGRISPCGLPGFHFIEASSLKDRIRHYRGGFVFTARSILNPGAKNVLKYWQVKITSL